MKRTAVLLLLSFSLFVPVQAVDLPVECDFESSTWFESWGLKESTRNTELVAADPSRKFVPLRGKALRIKIAKGSNYGTSLEYRFKKTIGHEPEELYFRYYLRLGDDWDPRTGGKFPGFGGTYSRAGWGGRPVNGRDGWSARGLFEARQDGQTPIGYYCYHADMKGKYGSHFRWKGGLANNRWYCIEQYCKLNTPGKNDGILRGWVDGKSVFEKSDLRMRDTDKLKIELIWFNLYHGGSAAAKEDHHIYLDDVVISRKPIGPHREKR